LLPYIAVLERLGRRTSEILDATVFCCGEVSDDWKFAGNDSLVYFLGKKVVKVYKLGPWPHMSLSERLHQVSLYQRITNLASCLSDSEDWQLRLPFNRISVPVRVIPIERIIQCSCCGSCASVSEFIEGKNLEEVKRSSLPFDVAELKQALPRFSLELNDRFSVFGISLTPINIKYLEGKLFITDLCSELSSLGERR
jgi:hypothetical protein